VTESTLKAQTAKTARDRLLETLRDGRYHSAHELEHTDKLKPGDWVVALRELIEFGYAFGRRSNSLIMRERALKEKPQDLADLLARIDSRVVEDMNSLTASQKAMADIKLKQEPRPAQLSSVPPSDDHHDEPPDFEVSDDAEDIAEEDKIVLSVDPKGFVLSGKLTLTSTQAIVAKKRSGKTYLAMVLAEQLLKHDLPFVAVDPTGVWVGLLSLASGAPSPYNILVLGGPRGERPLTADMGAAVAELIVEAWPRSIILDLSDLSPEDQHLFVFNLCTRIYTINKRPVHFFFDEADEFAPQSSDSNYKYQRRCLTAVDRFIRRGGAKGLGGTLITQRPAVINKNVLSQVGRLIVLNLVAPHDIEAVEDWMRLVVTSMSDRSACISALPHLRHGEAFAVTVGAGTIPLCRFMTRPKETFDSSRTPTMDETGAVVAQVNAPSADLLELVLRVLGPRELVQSSASAAEGPDDEDSDED
jgi:hypothetical protein